jgi:hypothetical protein
MVVVVVVYVAEVSLVLVGWHQPSVGTGVSEKLKWARYALWLRRFVVQPVCG